MQQAAGKVPEEDGVGVRSPRQDFGGLSNTKN